MGNMITRRDREKAADACCLGDDVRHEWIEKASAPAEVYADLEAWAQTYADHAAPERQALEACLLFFKGGAWTARDSKRWHELVGNHDQTSRSLCDKIREVLGIPPREGETR